MDRDEDKFIKKGLTPARYVNACIKKNVIPFSKLNFHPFDNGKERELDLLDDYRTEGFIPSPGDTPLGAMRKIYKSIVRGGKVHDICIDSDDDDEAKPLPTEYIRILLNNGYQLMKGVQSWEPSSMYLYYNTPFKDGMLSIAKMSDDADEDGLKVKRQTEKLVDWFKALKQKYQK